MRRAEALFQEGRTFHAARELRRTNSLRCSFHQLEGIRLTAGRSFGKRLQWRINFDEARATVMSQRKK